MAATYTAGSSADKDRVRLLIADTTVASALLQDEEILDLVVLEENIWLAAARALDIIATSEIMVLKKIRLLNGDIATDGPAVAKALRDLASSYRTRGAADDGGFEIIELGLDAHTRAEMRVNNFLKGVV